MSTVLGFLEGCAHHFNEAGYTVGRLLHVGWQDQDTHELIELDTDEDYQPPNTIPVFTLGSVKGQPPSLNDLE